MHSLLLLVLKGKGGDVYTCICIIYVPETSLDKYAIIVIVLAIEST